MSPPTWLHCNLCKVEKSTEFFMTACRKVCCYRCKIKMSSVCRLCRRDRCGIVELNKDAPKEVRDYFTDPKMHLKAVYKAYNFQASQQKMLLQHKLQRNARMQEEYEAQAEKNKACRNRLNQVKQADSELDQQIASREAEIERLKHQIRRGRNSDLSGGSMFRGPGEKKRSGRVEALFQKLESASQSPYQGGFAGSSSQLNSTKRSFFGDEANFFKVKTPAAWHKRSTRKLPHTMKTSSLEGKFFEIKTPAAWPKRPETSDWPIASPTNFFSPEN